MDNKKILQTAMQQSAYELNCQAEDFMAKENIITQSLTNDNARKYLTLPFDCHLVSYGNNIVASTSAALTSTVKKYIDTYPAEHCFETPNLHVLNDALQKEGLRICFMAEYFLPDLNRLKPLPTNYELRILHQEDFKNLYIKEWGNALCEKRRHLDVLGVSAYDNNKLIGLAACSADCDTMYQIGIDVLFPYRRQGVASALTSALALEILSLGKVPFYCAAWSNIKSVRNAVKCGFYPAWVELTAKPASFVADMNEVKESSTLLQ